MTIEREIRQRWKLQSLTSTAARDIFKTAPLIACIVDPRLKECKFLAPEKHIEVHGALTGLVCKEKKILLEEKQDNATSQTGEVSEPVAKKKRSGLAILLGDDYTNQCSMSSEIDGVEDSDPVLKEVELYLEKPIDREEPPLGWWKEDQHRFPLVSQVAKRYLTIPLQNLCFQLLD